MAADNTVTERRVLDRNTGELRFVKKQVITPIFFDAIRARRESVHPRSIMKYRGSVPILLAQQWARECGSAIGTKAWREYAGNQLDKADFAKLRGD